MGHSIRYDGDTIGNITDKLLMRFFPDMGVYRNIAILMGKHTVFHHWILGLILGQTHFVPTSEGEFIGETIEHIFDVATVAVGTLRCILEPQK